MISLTELGQAQQQLQGPDITQALAQAPVPHADSERQRKMLEAWKSYRGEFPAPLKVAADQPNDNATVNFCGPIAEKGASWLFNAPLKITATEKSSNTKAPTAASLIKPSPIQDFLNGFWGDEDDCMSLLADAALNGGVCGEVFLKLIPVQGNMKYPRIVVMDPLLVRIVTAPDDCSLTMAYVIEYVGINGLQSRQIIARNDPDGSAANAGEYDINDTWTITNYSKKAQASTWSLDGGAKDWEYPFPPIFCCKNLPNPNESWGTPDLTPDLIAQNKTLNFLLSNLVRIIKFHGHPKTWAKGVRAGQISIGVDDLIVLESTDAQLGTITPMERFDGILSVIANVMSNIDQQSRVPAVALGRQEHLPSGNLSGVALALMFQPLIEKTTQKRRLYGRLIREVSRAALVMAGLIPVEDFEGYKVALHWEPLLPMDTLVAAQEAVLLQSIGVSQETIFSGLGLSAEDEASKKAEEDVQKLVDYSRGVGLPPNPPAPHVPGQIPAVSPPVPDVQPQGQQKVGAA